MSLVAKRPRKVKLSLDQNADFRACIITDEHLSRNQANISGMEKDEENEIDLRKAADAQANHNMHEIKTPQVRFYEEFSLENEIPKRQSDRSPSEPALTSYQVLSNYYPPDVEDEEFCKANEISLFYLIWFFTMASRGPFDPEMNQRYSLFTGLPYSKYLKLKNYFKIKSERIRKESSGRMELFPAIARLQHMVGSNDSYGCFHPRPPKVSTRRKTQTEVKALEHVAMVRQNAVLLRLIGSSELLRVRYDCDEARKYVKLLESLNEKEEAKSTAVTKTPEVPEPQNPGLLKVVSNPHINHTRKNSAVFVNGTTPNCNGTKVNGTVLATSKKPEPMKAPTDNENGEYILNCLKTINNLAKDYIGISMKDGYIYPCPPPVLFTYASILRALIRSKRIYKKNTRKMSEIRDPYEKLSGKNFCKALVVALHRGVKMHLYDSRLDDYSWIKSSVLKATKCDESKEMYLRIRHLQRRLKAIGNPIEENFPDIKKFADALPLERAHIIFEKRKLKIRTVWRYNKIYIKKLFNRLVAEGKVKMPNGNIIPPRDGPAHQREMPPPKLIPVRTRNQALKQQLEPQPPPPEPPTTDERINYCVKLLLRGFDESHRFDDAGRIFVLKKPVVDEPMDCSEPVKSVPVPSNFQPQDDVPFKPEAAKLDALLKSCHVSYVSPFTGYYSPEHPSYDLDVAEKQIAQESFYAACCSPLSLKELVQAAKDEMYSEAEQQNGYDWTYPLPPTLPANYLQGNKPEDDSGYQTLQKPQFGR